MQQKSDVLLDAPHASHYKKMGIEPIEYIEANELPFSEGNIIKYVTRWRDKEGIKDLEKVIWYARRLIEQETKRLSKQLHPVEGPAREMTPLERKEWNDRG